MKLSRRQFVAWGAGTVAAAATGCDRHDQALEDARRWLGHPAAPVLPAELTPPSSAEIDPISHVLNRLSFGPRPGDHARVQGIGIGAYIEEQLAPEKMEDIQCDRLMRHEFEELGDPSSHFFPAREGHTALEQMFPAVLDSSGGRVGDLYEFRDQVLLKDLTRAALLRATLSRRQLHEVMVQFWSDHFNIDPSKGECKWLKVADDREVIRKHALGNFTEMLRASALSPAMLWYLDGRVNRVHLATDRPNENYARELMELHTMGVHGGYTQADVMQVARCLTGWTVRDLHQRQKGRVEFRPEEHDDGAKLVLGEIIPAGLGMGDLDRVLKIVTRHPSTARFLATKLCRRFIDDQPPEAAVVAVAGAFQQSGGEIRPTLRALFQTPEFAAARGTKLKRPFHFAVSALRATNARTDCGQPIVQALERMGHAPFHYPTPDGYPEEANHWMGTLLWRWNFAADLAANQLHGTTWDAGLVEIIGGEEALLATCLGRQLSAEEARAASASGAPLAFTLASPAFQRC